MSRKSLEVKQQKLEKKRKKYQKQGKKMPYQTRHYNRCKCCGRPRAYIREFGVCRVCFRKFARQGNIMWVRKASW